MSTFATQKDWSMVVIIAEKPSVARELAKIVGATTKRDGYLEGNGYAVTWAFGHLVGIYAPEADVPWRQENLPVLPPRFLLQVGTKTSSDGKKVPDEGYAHQLSVIKTLFDDADYIINAGDAGREGELIQRYIYAFTGSTKPVYRLWISSLTDNAIREGLSTLHNSSEFDTLYAAGKCRSEADWLVGINATRALSVLAGGRGVLSLGRVQTPTLAMVCKRFLENRDFVPQSFWTLKASASKDGIPFTASTPGRYLDKAKADEDYARVKADGYLHVQGVDTKPKTISPPYLHDLTSLQKEANKRYNLSAQQTLDAAQSLYEKKFLTYPRTGSKFIPEDVFATLPSLLGILEGDPRFGSYAASLRGQALSRHSVDKTKVTDHHALLPTEVRPGNLPDVERKIYELVLSRLLEAVSPKCEMLVTVVDFLSGGVKFTSKGSIVKVPGWKAVLGEWTEDGSKPQNRKKGAKSADDEAQEKDDNQRLPSFEPGDSVPILELECKEGRTKPKPLHTEASLLEAMEHAGRELTDEQLKDALKDVGIGTPATRAGEIETLLNRNYIIRKGKSLVPTELGLSIYSSVKDKYIANVEMTGRWETSLSKMVDGKVSPKAFDESIRRYVVALTDEILSDNVAKAALMASADPEAPRCPVCGGPMKFWETNARCRCCGYALWREIAHKKLSDSLLTKLLKNGKTQVLKGFKSKAGNEFSAALALGEGGKVVFDFTDVPRTPRKPAAPNIFSQPGEGIEYGEGGPPPPGIDDMPF